MAPYPEELDVFSIPHSRMKDLVEQYSTKMSDADFANSASTASLLRTLHATFEVFVSHERIENEFIMHELKRRLRQLQSTTATTTTTTTTNEDDKDEWQHQPQVEESALVCNCHSDNRLADMLHLVRDGRAQNGRRSLAERLAYGRRLRAELAEFTRTFLPHMREEEEVFQPMLLKYFEYDELRSLKDKVIEQHERLGSGLLTDDHEPDAQPEKFCLEVSDLKPDTESPEIASKEQEAVVVLKDVEETTAASPFECLPPEVTLHIFSYLWPPDLARSSAVCSQWRSLARHSTLWHRLLPTNWSKGVWINPDDDFYPDEDRTSPNDDEDLCPRASGCRGGGGGASCGQQWRRARDEDADVDESCESDQSSEELDEARLEEEDNWQRLDIESCSDMGPDCVVSRRAERRTVEALAQHLLPHVGATVHFLSFAGSRCLDAKWLAHFLSECSQLRKLNLSYTNLNDHIIDSVRHQLELWHGGVVESGPWNTLRHLDLSGCRALSDDGFVMLLDCLRLCSATDNLAVVPSAARFQFLSLSGCSRLTDVSLRYLLSMTDWLSGLQYLDVSGCSQLSGATLGELVAACPNLRPEQLYYCDNVSDGPYQQTANGCQNRGNQWRTCCCSD